jgi:hypothetical protein
MDPNLAPFVANATGKGLEVVASILGILIVLAIIGAMLWGLGEKLSETWGWDMIGVWFCIPAVLSFVFCLAANAKLLLAFEVSGGVGLGIFLLATIMA